MLQEDFPDWKGITNDIVLITNVCLPYMGARIAGAPEAEPSCLCCVLTGNDACTVCPAY